MLSGVITVRGNNWAVLQSQQRPQPPQGRIGAGRPIHNCTAGGRELDIKSHVNPSVDAGCPKKGAVMSGRAALFN